MTDRCNDPSSCEEQLPLGWRVARLDEIADVIDPQPDHRTPPSVPDGVPYVAVNNFFSDGSIDIASCRKVSHKVILKQRSSFTIDEGDIIFGKIGTVGSPRFLPLAGFDYGLSANVVLIKPKAVPPFVLSWLQSDAAAQQIRRQLHTTSQPAFGIQRIRALKLSLPPLPEQHKIAEILGTWDRAIALMERRIAAHRQRKKGLMQDLLTGRRRFPEFAGQPWKRSKLRDLLQIEYGRSPSQIKGDIGQVPIYGTGGVVGWTSQALHARSSVIIGRKGSIDRVQLAEGPFWAIDTTFYGMPKEQVDVLWIYYMLCHIDLRNYNEASGVPSLSRGTLYNIKVEQPSLPEQRKIAALLGVCDQEIDLHTRKLAALREQKKGLMQQLLTGRVRVQI